MILKKAFQNIVGKGENAVKMTAFENIVQNGKIQCFLRFALCFLPYQRSQDLNFIQFVVYICFKFGQI